ncbi:MAG: chromate resistance protein ChrB domain-containing protein [Massilia sp.]
MSPPTTSWLLLIVSMPTGSASARMRLWRSLKQLGCGALRDGAYVLPAGEAREQTLRALADDTLREGGSAWLLTMQAGSGAEEDSTRALFDRRAEHAALATSLVEARGALATLAPQEISRLLRKLRRELESLRAIDYFPDDAALLTESAWLDLQHAAESRLAPGEPQAGDAAIVRRDRAQFQDRLWATRRHLWVDRVASAWLILRFIDPGARFLWLATPADCPLDALGFDFDGAAFTHVGELVTFEVLIATFGLGDDAGLQRLAAMVHVLDLGRGFVAEAPGFEAVLSGARQRAPDDDALLAEIGPVLDSFYTYFSTSAT